MPPPNAPPLAPSTPRPWCVKPCTPPSNAWEHRQNATVLEPGCGTGGFFRDWHPRWSYIGIEPEPVSASIARVLHPRATVLVEDFADTRLTVPIQVVLGNVPFADVSYDYAGGVYPLHDFCLLKSLDLLEDGGLMAIITSHYTLDKADDRVRLRLSGLADFLGAVRFPSGAFRAQGTEVLADILFLRKRLEGQPPNDVDPEWIWTEPQDIDGQAIRLSRYFVRHPERVLGRYHPARPSLPWGLCGAPHRRPRHLAGRGAGCPANQRL